MNALFLVIALAIGIFLGWFTNAYLRVWWYRVCGSRPFKFAVVAALRSASVDVWKARYAYGVLVLAILVVITFTGTS